MKTFYLHGAAAQFGESFSLNVQTPAEMIVALSMQIPGFREVVEEGSWHLLRGPLEKQDDDDIERLHLSLEERNEVHLVPAVRGANGGKLSVIIGVALISASFLVTGGGLMLVAAGAGMLLGGIVQMTTKVPGGNPNRESADNKGSFLLSVPTNQSSQGVTIPRGYGRYIVGSIVISVGMSAEAITE